MSISLGIVGCGDVAFRTYFPGFAPEIKRGSAHVSVCFDPLLERAEAAAALFPGAKAVATLEELLAEKGLTAAINLTPAPFHKDVTTSLLNADLHVYTEKPLAASVKESQELIALAKRKKLHLLCAPAVMVTNRMKWIKQIVAAGKIGRPTMAVAQQANMGPHAWRAYTGDPRVHYSAAVGPLIDTGVYALHAVTGMLGPVKRVQAFGGIAIPKRTILVERYLGEEITVGSNDQMLIHLDFGDNVFAQVLSSFAVPRTKAPAFELYGSGGTISIASGDWYNANGPADIMIRDETPLGIEDWQTASPPNQSPHTNLIGAGVPHLIGVLREEEAPILTAEHACHVLEIMLTAIEAAGTGQTVDLATTF